MKVQKEAFAFQKTTLDGGVRVLSEHYPHCRSLVVGFWVGVGARFESKTKMGISHLLEHMVFKGTEKYNAFGLARCLEARGGEINAFTEREYTCFYTSSLKEDMDLAVDVLTQLCAFAHFDNHEFKKEKGVVRQEILMASDDPEESIYDLYYQKIFPDHPLGYPILGSMDSIEALSLSDLKTHYDKHFTSGNIIVTAAGFVDHDQLVASVDKYFSKKRWKNTKTPKTGMTIPVETPVNDFFVKDSEQYHILVGFPSHGYSNINYFSAFIVNLALGGGMTSKLYQSLREQRGLVYNVSSLLNPFIDIGVQTVYAATQEDNVKESVDLIRKELKELKEKGLNSEDIELYKTQAKGQIIIDSNDIDDRANSIAISEMVFGEYRSLDQIISDIDRVSKDSVMEFIDLKLDLDHLNLFMLGPKPMDLF